MNVWRLLCGEIKIGGVNRVTVSELSSMAIKKEKQGAKKEETLAKDFLLAVL